MRRRSNSRAKAARTYAEHGWAVFPCNGKVPARGLKWKDVATTDLETVERWWQHPHNIGVACGPSRLLVVDVDAQAGGVETYKALVAAGWSFPVTRSQATPSGGFHLFYAMPTPPLGNRAGGIHGYPDPTPGIDIRGEGGYVIVAPSRLGLGRSYEWVRANGVEIVPAPLWMSQSAKPREIPYPKSRQPRGNGYAETALRSEAQAVATAPEGTRNHQLNTSVFKIWRLVASGHLPEATVIDAFTRAGEQAGLRTTEIRATIASAARGRRG